MENKTIKVKKMRNHFARSNSKGYCFIHPISLILSVTFVLCIWAILATALDIDCLKFHFDLEKKTCDAWNDIIKNLAFSFLAGHIFYGFTSWLPQLIHNRKMEEVLKYYDDGIEVCIKNILYVINGEMKIFNCETDSINTILERKDEITKAIKDINWCTPVPGPTGLKTPLMIMEDCCLETQEHIKNYITKYYQDLREQKIIALENLSEAVPYAFFRALAQNNVNINENNVNGITEEITVFLGAVEEYQQHI